MQDEQLPIDSGFRTSTALPAYVSATASVEAFLNEVFLSATPFSAAHVPTLASFRETLERIRLDVKVLLIPQLAYAHTLDKGAQPYQDMALLIKLRNEIVHYKMGVNPPSCVRTLARHDSL